MSDTYISKVTSIKPEPTVIHQCGTKSFSCEVESPMYDGAYWCPTCKVFWAIDEDCWHDKDTIWDAKIPSNNIRPKDNLPYTIELMLGEIEDQKRKLLLKEEMIEKLDTRRIELEETIIANELEAEELDKVRQRLDYELAGQKKLVQGYNGIMEELHKMYGADNEVLNEMETRILGEVE